MQGVLQSTAIRNWLEERAKRLLDLTPRNPLLLARSRLEPIAPPPEVIWKKLLWEEEWLVLQAAEDESGEDEAPRQLAAGAGRNLPVRGREVDERTLLFRLRPEDLERRLKRYERDARTTFDDAGFWTLFFAFGALEWKPTIAPSGTSTNKTWFSPLVLVPITLQRQTPAQPFTLSLREGEDIQLNRTLLVYLTEVEQLSFPDIDPNGEGTFQSLLAPIREAVTERGWTVHECCWIGRFAFQKTAIYQDLRRNAERIASHPVIRVLSGLEQPPPRFALDPPETFDVAPPEEIATVLPADSSQLQAVFAARRGQTFVIQGPPGTGKSQTIVNIIADQLARGKSVLFVSEKRAALEVVERRLEKVGLAPFCLNLHSHQAQRGAVLQSIAEELERNWTVPYRHPQDLPAQVAYYRDRLRDYATALHTPRPPLGQTLFQVIARLQALPDPGTTGTLRLNPKTLTTHDIAHLREVAGQLAASIDLLREGSSFPWFGVRDDVPESRLADRVEAAARAFDQLLEQLRSVCTSLGLPEPSDAQHLRSVAEQLQRFAAAPPFPAPWTERKDVSQWVAWVYEATRILARLAELRPHLHPALSERILEASGPPCPARECHRLADQARLLADVLSPLGPSIERTQIARIVAAQPILEEALQALTQELDRLTRALGIDLQRQRPALASLVALAACQADRLTLPLAWCRRTVRPQLEKVAELVATLRAEATLRRTITASWDASVLSEEMLRHVSTWRNVWSHPLRAFRLTYWRARRLLQRAYRGTGPFQSAVRELFHDFAQLEQFRTTIQRLSGPDEAGPLLEEVPDDVRRDPERLATLLAAAQLVLDNRVDPRLLQILTGTPDLAGGVREHAAAFLQAWRTVEVMLEHVQITLPDTLRVGPDTAETMRDIVQLIEDFDRWWTAVEEYLPCELPAQTLTELLRQVAEIAALQESLVTIESTVRQAWGFVPERSPAAWEVVLEQLRLWQDVCALLPADTVPPGLRAAALDPGQRHGLRQLAAALDRVQEELAALAHVFANDPLRRTAGLTFDEAAELFRLESPATRTVALAPLGSLLTALRERLPDVRRYRLACVARDQLSDALSPHIVTAFITRQDIDPESLPDRVEAIVLQHWIDAIAREEPAIATFQVAVHEQYRAKFWEFDTALERWQAERLVESLNQPRREIFITHPAVHLLLHEAKKRRRHRPLRALFRDAFPTILKIKPCWLMSPLSVSHFLQPDHQFDIVIIDEASQVRPEEAIPALYRARQVVVCGDSKQLPPTRFFEAAVLDMLEPTEEEEEELYRSAGIGESILEALEPHYPTVRLLWHYRSKDERLIAFSNAVFYSSSLITVPTPSLPARPTGIVYRFVDGVYQRGKAQNDQSDGSGRTRQRRTGRTNQREIEEVCRLVEEHLRRWGTTRSLGVVTMNLEQKEAIWNELDERAKVNPTLRLLLDPTQWPDGEEFFVKNLEAVQGDERDVIIVSTVFGRDAEGVFTLQLGPLTQAGGERRLNVLITRAREQVILVTSLRPEDFQLKNEERQESLRLFRDYLRFARDGVLPPIARPRHDSLYESAFERSVAEVIESWGYRVIPQYGVGPYRIDLAIPDPEDPQRVCIAVECDGATYHSLPTVRERDRLRQHWLERNGWKVIRVWSTDWWYHRSQAQAALRQSLEAAVAELRANSPRPPEAHHEPQRVSVVPRHFRPSDNVRDILLQKQAVTFYQPGSRYGGIPRIAAPDRPETVRRIEDIPSEELQKLLIVVAEAIGPVPQDTLLTEVTRLLGFQRKGSRIAAHLQRAVKTLLARGVFAMQDGRIVRQDRPSA